MCGIWATFGINGGLSPACIKCFATIKHRGPDAWRLEHEASEPLAVLGFQRLTILDSLHGMQPMRIHRYPRIALICNGDIYNYKLLKTQYNFAYETDCDVEAIIHAYCKFEIEEAVKKLDGVFAFCLVDGENNKVHIARDPYGVRPLFLLNDTKNSNMAISSEAKGLMDLKKKASDTSTLGQFPPGHIQTWNILDNGLVKHEEIVQYFTPGTISTCFVPNVSNKILARMNNQEKIAHLLEAACEKRLMSDRRIGCFLSGGLDSSLIASLVVKLAKKHKLPYKIQTFAIGMDESPDLIAARTVAEHLGTEHHEVRFDEKDVAQVLDTVIYHLESYDITTVRASIPMYLLSKYIQKNTDTTVVFSGEGADELAQGYIYFKDAPSVAAAHKESLRLLSNTFMYDGLRADRMINAFSLEIRIPFLDIQFTHEYLCIDPELRKPQNGIEKYLLRSSFANSNLLPESILWRHKEAFSDGVSSVKKSLLTIIGEIVNERYSDNHQKYEGTQPTTTESKYYRHIFEKNFRGQYNFTPYYWMPKWVQAKDPSARFIKHYSAH